MWTTICIIVVSGLAAERFTEVLAVGDIFKPFKKWLWDAAFHVTNDSGVVPFHRSALQWLHKLLTCSYCISHWASLLMVSSTRFCVDIDGRLPFVVEWFSTVFFAGLMHEFITGAHLYRITKLGQIADDADNVNGDIEIQEGLEDGTS